MVVHQELAAVCADRPLQGPGDADAVVAFAGVGSPALGGGVGVGPPRNGLGLGAAFGVSVLLGGLSVRHEDALFLNEFIRFAHMVRDGAHVIAVVIAGGEAQSGGVVQIILVRGILDAVALLDFRSAAGMQVAAADGGVAADIPVRFDDDDGSAVFHGLESGGKARSARADDHNVRFVIPLDLLFIDRRSRFGGLGCGFRSLLGIRIGRGRGGACAKQAGAGNSHCSDCRAFNKVASGYFFFRHIYPS